LESSPTDIQLSNSKSNSCRTFFGNSYTAATQSYTQSNLWDLASPTPLGHFYPQQPVHFHSPYTQHSTSTHSLIQKIHTYDIRMIGSFLLKLYNELTVNCCPSREKEFDTRNLSNPINRVGVPPILAKQCCSRHRSQRRRRHMDWRREMSTT
jgi:hypothetical protein